MRVPGLEEAVSKVIKHNYPKRVIDAVRKLTEVYRRIAAGANQIRWVCLCNTCARGCPTSDHFSTQTKWRCPAFTTGSDGGHDCCGPGGEWWDVYRFVRHGLGGLFSAEEMRAKAEEKAEGWAKWLKRRGIEV